MSIYFNHMSREHKNAHSVVAFYQMLMTQGQFCLKNFQMGFSSLTLLQKCFNTPT